MTNKQIEAVAVTQSARDAAADWVSDEYGKGVDDQTLAKIRKGGMDDSNIVQAFAAAEQRGMAAAIAAMPDRQAAMIEGARLALEAAANDAATWFPANTQATFKAGGVVGSIRALDPAQIVGGNTAIERGEHLERGE